MSAELGAGGEEHGAGGAAAGERGWFGHGKSGAGEGRVTSREEIQGMLPDDITLEDVRHGVSVIRIP